MWYETIVPALDVEHSADVITLAFQPVSEKQATPQRASYRPGVRDPTRSTGLGNTCSQLLCAWLRK